MIVVVLNLPLTLKKHGTHEVITIPVIQYIVGDCKGNDTLCGRKVWSFVVYEGSMP